MNLSTGGSLSRHAKRSRRLPLKSHRCVAGRRPKSWRPECIGAGVYRLRHDTTRRLNHYHHGGRVAPIANLEAEDAGALAPSLPRPAVRYATSGPKSVNYSRCKSPKAFPELHIAPPSSICATSTSQTRPDSMMPNYHHAEIAVRSRGPLGYQHPHSLYVNQELISPSPISTYSDMSTGAYGRLGPQSSPRLTFALQRRRFSMLARQSSHPL